MFASASFRNACALSILVLASKAGVAQNVISVKPATAVIEDFAVGGRPEVEIPLMKMDGGDILVDGHAPAPYCFKAISGSAPTVVFRNEGERALRVTIRQPTDSDP